MFLKFISLSKSNIPLGRTVLAMKSPIFVSISFRKDFLSLVYFSTVEKDDPVEYPITKK